jgi:hypothetical protein
MQYDGCLQFAGAETGGVVLKREREKRRQGKGVFSGRRWDHQLLQLDAHRPRATRSSSHSSLSFLRRNKTTRSEGKKEETSFRPFFFSY